MIAASVLMIKFLTPTRGKTHTVDEFRRIGVERAMISQVTLFVLYPDQLYIALYCVRTHVPVSRAVVAVFESAPERVLPGEIS